MALLQYWWFLTFVLARAQKSLHINEPSNGYSVETTSVRSSPTKIRSYNPTRVCFNPQYDPYFKNDLLSTSPIPQPNIYFANNPDTVATNLRFAENLSTNNLVPFVLPWTSFLGRNYVPLVYIPSLLTGGQVDSNTLKYLKRLKNALNANPLLASRNRTSPSLKNHVEIKFGTFPPDDNLPVPFSKLPETTEQTTTKQQVCRIDEIKAQKMTSYLKNYNRRKKKRKNDGTNAYPLPKVVYTNHRTSEPTTIYNRYSFLTEIYNQNI